MSDAGAPPSCFPTEVYEEIIQWVPLGIRLPSKKSVEDHPEIRLSCLCSCALTCRAWLPASRACLYKSISFLSDDKTSLERFVRSLDTNPWLGTLVVYLNVYDLFPRRQAALLPPPRDTILTTWAPMLAGKLPSLHTLQVGFVDHLSRHLLFIKCMRSFSAITTLVLDLSYLPTFADLLRFLTSFPKLQTVSSTRAIQWPVRGSIPPMRPDRFPAISRLFLRMILLPTSLGKRHVAHMLLNITRDSVRVLGIRSTFGCPSPIGRPPVCNVFLQM
ncbi:hypothetical protein C8Q70DRAFT_596129 [Cubamyces menziesii]|nr:hypothetical protein C8Q70DRAFT_596129 [Cubamyces menziesii]